MLIKPYKCGICGVEYATFKKKKYCENAGIFRVKAKTLFNERDENSSFGIMFLYEIKKNSNFPGHYPIYRTLSVQLDAIPSRSLIPELYTEDKTLENLDELSEEDYDLACDIFAGLKINEDFPFKYTSLITRGRRLQIPTTEEGILNNKLEYCIRSEDYEKASRIKKELDNIFISRRLQIRNIS